MILRIMIVVGMLLGLTGLQFSAIRSWDGCLLVLEAIAPFGSAFISASAIFRCEGGGKDHFDTVIVVCLAATLFSAGVTIRYKE